MLIPLVRCQSPGHHVRPRNCRSSNRGRRVPRVLNDERSEYYIKRKRSHGLRHTSTSTETHAPKVLAAFIAASFPSFPTSFTSLILKMWAFVLADVSTFGRTQFALGQATFYRLVWQAFAGSKAKTSCYWKNKAAKTMRKEARQAYALERSAAAAAPAAAAAAAGVAAQGNQASI